MASILLHRNPFKWERSTGQEVVVKDPALQLAKRSQRPFSMDTNIDLGLTQISLLSSVMDSPQTHSGLFI